MKSPIFIREAVAEKDVTAFWEQLHSYHKRDIFTNPNDEDLTYFLSSEYQDHMMELYGRTQDRCYFLFFSRADRDIGFAIPVIYSSEDGKCFIMEFCIYPEFRGNGTGTQCAGVLLEWAKENGALYAELNYGSDDRRRHFWEGVGFRENGADEWGDPLMLLPPIEEAPINIDVLDDPNDWQLKKLENGYLLEIGEETLSEEKQERLVEAVRDGSITFFIARRGYRAVGMCSVATCFSTFSCADIGMFEDFYIEPVFRKKGIARKLTEFAQNWCRRQGISSLSVCCAPCDEHMYRALGFDMAIGFTLVHME